MAVRSELIDVIREKALEFGEFTLASGKTANFYLDCRRVTLDSHGSRLIATEMIQLMDKSWPDAVGGMAVGAVPITAAILAYAGEIARPLRGFFVRKEAKGHGKGKQVEGPVSPGDRVVIVEDVVTTGGSSIQAIRHCEEFGLKIEGVYAIIDRLAGGKEAFAEAGYELQTLMTIDDLDLPPQ